jgi:toxin ParE1/3/4
VIRRTQRARADLKSIHDFIAKDSLPNAKTVVREILRRADTLEMAPHMGRVVPELRKPELREISAYSWRIIYLPRDGELFIVSVIHHPHDARLHASR